MAKNNTSNLVNFKKGFDPRRNLKGPPKSVLPELKEILSDILSEETTEKRTGAKLTKLENILRVLEKKAKAGDMKAIQEILDRYYGKPNQHIEQKTRVEIDMPKIEIF